MQFVVKSNPRFVVKFNNGAWKVFDNHHYTDYSIHSLKVEAEAFAITQNAREVARGINR